MGNTCAERIAEALSIRGMRQYELCEKTKIPKSAMSQYIRGSFEPKQDRLLLIARALDVSPVWLMGYDVPMDEKENSPDERQLTEGEKALLDLFGKVPEDKQAMVIEMIRAALGTQK